MSEIIIWGYGYAGVKLYSELKRGGQFKVIGFADNSTYKQGMYVNGHRIYALQDLIELKNHLDFSVIIAAQAWYVIGRELKANGINIEGIYIKEKIEPYRELGFERLDLEREVRLYAGDICDDVHMSEENLYGLSINKADSKHILHDITKAYPLPDNCVSSYQAEDVLEHIPRDKVLLAVNEIYRILRNGALFRICLPDYFSPYLKTISMTDRDGNIVYDPTGGGSYRENGVENGGHLWFPNYINVKEILEHSMFENINFLCYHTKEGKLVYKDIDFSKGFVQRVFKKEKQDVYSIVIDCYKRQ